MRIKRAAHIVWSLVCCLPLLIGRAFAGGGPENVLLVANESSWASKLIANYYQSFRDIPSSNVLYLNWRGGHITDVNTFRNVILEPIIQAIETRGLASQIDYIVYSADLPYSVHIGADKGEGMLMNGVGPNGSLNGLTYLHSIVRAKNPLYLGPVNLYVHPVLTSSADTGTHGFRSWYGWGKDGEVLETGGLHYMLSTMLGVTHGRGNSPQEIVGYLRRSSLADGSRPKGTIYYMNNGDIRVRARRYGNSTSNLVDQFVPAVARLQELGIHAEIDEGILPTGKQDVAGLMTGAMKFDCNSSRIGILPGAICENFTSYGGIFDDAIGEKGVASQTPLSAFLRAGAAGSSGTVAEPLSLQSKFPLPSMHVHYARGCSLAEAFYQALPSPWQLLIVGEPLCRPWARIPQVSAAGVEPGATVRGVLTLTPAAANPGGSVVDRFELFVDGKKTAVCPQGGTLMLDTAGLVDGVHALSIVGIEAGPIETQGRASLSIKVANGDALVLADTRPRGSIALGEEIKLGAKCDGAASIVFRHNGRELGKIMGAQGSFAIDSSVLGQGPVNVTATAIGANGEELAISAPIPINVLPPPARPAVALPSGIRLRNALLLRFAGKSVPLDDTTQYGWFGKTGIGSGEDFTVSGYFGAVQDDMYQFRVTYSGGLKLRVDGELIHEAANQPSGTFYLPLSLAKGIHKLDIEGRTASSKPQFELSFGGPHDGVRAVDGTRFQHIE